MLTQAGAYDSRPLHWDSHSLGRAVRSSRPWNWAVAPMAGVSLSGR